MVKILIVKLGAIGDVLRTTALLPGLGKKYGPAAVDWLASARSKEILLNNPLVNNIYDWEDKNTLGPYDLVVNLEDDLEVAKRAAGIKAKEIIGVYLGGYTPSVWFDMSLISKFGLNEANRLKKGNKKTFQQLMGELLGIEVFPYVFSLTPDEIEYGRKVAGDLRISKKGRVVGVNTGAGKRWPQKSWGIESTIKLIKKLTAEPGITALILGGDEERERNKLISSRTGMPEAGVHSLRQFAAIINQCDVILSSDSLAMHLAIALKKRIVAFFGPTSSAEIELYGQGEKISAPVDCAVCYKKECSTKPGCMDAISPEVLFDAIKRQLPQ